MNRVILAAIIFFLISGCEKQEIGYLDVTNAAYIPDSVVYKAVLNPDDPEDAHRIKFEIPFQSPAIQQIQGTLPITYSIHRIDCDNGAEDAAGQFSMEGKGKIKLPFNHTVPAGKYIISMDVSNEGHFHTLDSVLTIIIR